MKFFDHNYVFFHVTEKGRGLITLDLIAKSIWYGAGQDKWKLMLLKDGTVTTIMYRLMALINRLRIPVLDIALGKFITLFSGAVIGRKARFGPGLVLVHTVGVVINGSVKGGNNIIIQHGVTLGAEREQSPILGNNIFIGAGAKIFGSITVGDGVKIGANTVVNFDVPDGATVVGVPGRIISAKSVK